MWPWPWPQLSPELAVKCQASGQLVHCKVFYLLVVGKQNRSTPYLTVIVWVLPFNALYIRPLRYAKPYTGRLCMSDYSVLSVESRLRLLFVSDFVKTNIFLIEKLLTFKSLNVHEIPWPSILPNVQVNPLNPWNTLQMAQFIPLNLLNKVSFTLRFTCLCTVFLVLSS